MNFQLLNFQLYHKLLKDGFLGKQLILFPSNLARDQSFKSVYCCFLDRKKLLEILNAGIDRPIMIFVNQKKVRIACHRSR